LFAILSRTGRSETPAACPPIQWLPNWLWALVAALPFRKRAFGNRVVVVIVVGIAGVVMQRPNGVRSDPFFEFFHG